MYNVRVVLHICTCTYAYNAHVIQSHIIITHSMEDKQTWLDHEVEKLLNEKKALEAFEKVNFIEIKQHSHVHVHVHVLLR